jgi:hypothetical protein
MTCAMSGTSTSQELLGKRDALGAVALGRQARLAGGELGQRLGYDRARLARVIVSSRRTSR